MPNAISALRIICAITLLFLEPLSVLFLATYVVCGISDFLDGYIARRTKHVSQFGATLDSIADVIFFGVLLIIFIPLLKISLWMRIWIGAIIMIRISSLIIGAVKYRTLVFIHTYANKVTGMALFCFPFLYNYLGLPVTVMLLCGMAGISATEELIINIISKRPSRDRKSIFVR